MSPETLERLVERLGGVPADKVEGLRGLAAAAGIDDAAFEARLCRHRQLGSGPGTGDAVLRQVRDGLEELGRIEGARVPSLHAFLELPPTADRATVRRRRDALLVLNRQRRPDRRRALVDDLLAAVGEASLGPRQVLDAVSPPAAREAARGRKAEAAAPGGGCPAAVAPLGGIGHCPAPSEGFRSECVSVP
jgi:hypothetical protein